MTYPPQMHAEKLFDSYSKKSSPCGRENNINIKDRAAEAIEFLIYCWLSYMTNFYDANHTLSQKRNPIKRNPIKEIMMKNQSLKDNTFLKILYSDSSNMENDGYSMMDITLPEDIMINREMSLQHNNGYSYPTSGTITIKRKHFTMKIKYEEVKYKNDLLSPSFPLKLYTLVAKSDIIPPINNPIFYAESIKELSKNIGWTKHRIEFHGYPKLHTLIRSIL
jgi:hypothetical protein